MRLGVQSGQLLQPRRRQADRAAIDRGRPGEAQAAGVADRTQAGGGQRPTDHLLQPRRNVLATGREGADVDGQQHFQRQSSGGYLARQITALREASEMNHNLRTAAVASLVLVVLWGGNTAFAQKQGGILKTYDPDSPGGLSIQEEETVFARGPMMGVFNNLIMYDQHVPQNSLASIVPDLATSWEWNEEGTALTFKLRQGVKFHDGKPFTAKDVKCTWDLRMDLAPQKLRINPGKSAYYNLAEVTA